MRVIIIGAAALILLGIVIFSVPYGSNSGVISNDKGMIQKIENNSSIPEASKDWDVFKEVAADPNNSGNLHLEPIRKVL